MAFLGETINFRLNTAHKVSRRNLLILLGREYNSVPGGKKRFTPSKITLKPQGTLHVRNAIPDSPPHYGLPPTCH